MIEDVIQKIRKDIDSHLEVFSDASVEYGKMGAAVFYYYYQYYFDNKEYLLKGESLIEESINLLSNISSKENHSLKFKGESIGQTISSFGKGLIFIQRHYGENYDFSENFQFLNDVLFETAKQSMSRKDHDYFSGSLASGYYFLNKYNYDKDPFSRYALNKIVRSILKDAILLNDQEVYWKSPTYNNQIYLGLSHGSAMIINFLSKIVDFRIYDGEYPELKEIVKKAISFVINRDRDFHNGFFPHKFPLSEKLVPTQLSMCYGDLGIILSIYKSIKTFKFYEFEERIEKISKITSIRKLNSAYTEDASILYGCSGLYHMYRDLFETTSDKTYLQVYKYWYKQIMSYRNSSKQNLAGFQFQYENDRKIDSSAKYSFYWGIAGIGITLMIENNKKLPKVNELLLIGS
ncbi:lanthionine synthetase LanC family protein [Zunongwangia sp. H14]|uniref:lanthionine synthetase LanC family protein n=1 Tax=Zunongwangia sp. H14 TaxID=3240792 RepID=UPI00356893FB